MSLVANESMTKIAKGTAIVLVGTMLALLFGFIGRIMVARYGTESDYGAFSLALVILNVLVVIATLGLQQGATRYIAYFRGKDDLERVQGTISASIIFASLASIFLGLILFFAADIISTGIFHNPELAYPLRIFAIGVPFLTLLGIFTSIFRGFDRVEVVVCFQNILISAIFPLLLVIILLLSLPFSKVFPAYLASAILSFVAVVIYTIKRPPLSMKFALRTGVNLVGKKLLLFSLPLLSVAVLLMIIVWTDTLMLGYFKTSGVVGLYSAAHPLAQFISMPIAAMQLIYLPITSRLYGQNRLSEIRRNYKILTKWLCSLTLPLFLVFFLFPESVLSFAFGAAYAPASQALRILCLGFFVNNLLGLNNASLIALGKSTFLMWAALAAAVINVGLNVVLIPPMGITGASIASLVAITSVNVIRAVKLYSLTRAQPLSKNLLKPTLASVALILLIYAIAENFLTVTLWMMPLFFILYCIIYGLAILFTRSFDQEDITVLLEIERRTRINATPIKKILARFLQ